MANHRLNFKASQNIFRRTAVKQKKLNNPDVLMRGGIRL